MEQCLCVPHIDIFNSLKKNFLNSFTKIFENIPFIRSFRLFYAKRSLFGEKKKKLNSQYQIFSIHVNVKTVISFQNFLRLHHE